MLKVFLVEDEIVIREGIQKMIPWGDYGFELSGEAADGEIALPLIRQVRPDVLITDIKMPFMDGLSLSSLVKKEMPETKIVIISGYDDFSYAQQAISVGVERYLLKPVSKNAFVEVLQDIRNKYEVSNAQKKYYEKFLSEMQEYEKHSRRDFFEELILGETKLQDIYEKADKLKIDILAENYNIVLFTMNDGQGDNGGQEEYSQDIADVQQEIDEYFAGHAEYLLFRNHVFSYAVLIKGNQDTIEEKTQVCVEALQEIFGRARSVMSWFVCDGKKVERLSQIPQSYRMAMRSFSMRYISETNTIRSKEQQEVSQTEDFLKVDLKKINAGAVSPEIIQNFMSNGLEDEVESFVDNYLCLFGEEALQSKMFRQYILLNVHFCAVSFLQKIGVTQELGDGREVLAIEGHKSVEIAKSMMKDMLDKVIELRDENAKNCYKSVVSQAVRFIQENYTDENLSLNRVARSVNVSANHFSALFSQEMQKTFIEYVTDLRMKRAKELLRCSDKRSGEIALEVGYKDAHYFSFLFKKTQGCTPSEYRNRSFDK